MFDVCVRVCERLSYRKGAESPKNKDRTVFTPRKGNFKHSSAENNLSFLYDIVFVVLEKTFRNTRLFFLLDSYSVSCCVSVLMGMNDSVLALMTRRILHIVSLFCLFRPGDYKMLASVQMSYINYAWDYNSLSHWIKIERARALLLCFSLTKEMSFI